MTLPKTPYSVIQARQREKSLTEEYDTLSDQIIEEQGFTLGTVPQGQYKLRGGGYRTVDAWERIDEESPYSSTFKDINSDFPLGFTEDWSSGNRRIMPNKQLKEGYRYNENIQAKGYDMYDAGANPDFRMVNAGIERMVKRQVREPYEWEWDDPYESIRNTLTTKETARTNRMNAIGEELSSVYGRTEFSRKKTSEGTQRVTIGARRRSILTGGLGLSDRPNIFKRGRYS